MLRALPPLLLAVCLLLLAEDCAHAAAEAFALWWSSVLPALFPFYLCTSLLLRSGAAQSLVRLLRPVSRLLRLPQGVLPCLLLGGVAGYPTGARLCASLGAAQYGARCSLCSPMFLIVLVGGGLLRGGGSAPLLCLAHYGAALLLLPLRCAGSDDVQPVPEAEAGACAGGALRMVGDGMAAMVQIGGCIAGASVLAALLRHLGLHAALDALAKPLGLPAGLMGALAQGMLEFTGGCAAVAALGLPLRMAAAACAFLVSFGGLSVFLQTRLFLSGGAGRYFLLKLLHGALAAAIAYLCAPLLLADAAAVMAQPAQEYALNALSGASLLFACAVTVIAAYLGALALSALPARRQARDRGRPEG